MACVVDCHLKCRYFWPEIRVDLQEMILCKTLSAISTYILAGSAMCGLSHDANRFTMPYTPVESYRCTETSDTFPEHQYKKNEFDHFRSGNETILQSQWLAPPPLCPNGSMEARICDGSPSLNHAATAKYGIVVCQGMLI